MIVTETSRSAFKWNKELQEALSSRVTVNEQLNIEIKAKCTFTN
jgi:hypothetical protein